MFRACCTCPGRAPPVPSGSSAIQSAIEKFKHASAAYIYIYVYLSAFDLAMGLGRSMSGQQGVKAEESEEQLTQVLQGGYAEVPDGHIVPVAPAGEAEPHACGPKIEMASPENT